MNIGVVGTFIRDRILPWRRPETASIGGLFFTTSYLAKFAEPGTTILPVACLGEDFADEVRTALAVYPNVDLSATTILPRPNTQVTLTYSGPVDREEVTTTPMPPLQASALEPLLDADAVVVNLITGYDVELDALQAFRKRARGLLYLDFHSRALAIDRNGKRFHRQPGDWQEWVRQADVLQLNEMEAATLSGLAPEDRKGFEVFAQRILDLGPSVCHITLGEHGSLWCRRSQGQVEVHKIAQTAVDEVVDTTGCGDAFEAAYIASVLAGATEVDATRFAHKAAAFNCSFAGSTGIFTESGKIRAHAH